MSERGVELTGLLRATVEALGVMDAAALEGLRAEALLIAAMGKRPSVFEARRALALQDALGELLRSTDRSLRMLRGLRDAGLRRAGFESMNGAMAWER